MKSKLGISYIAISIIAFMAAFLGSFEGLLIILAGVLIIEKDKWLSIQVLQALYLYLVFVTISLLNSTIFDSFTINRYGDRWESINAVRNVIENVLRYGKLLLVLWAVLRLKDGKDAELLGIHNWACKTVDVIQEAVHERCNQKPSEQESTQPAPEPTQSDPEPTQPDPGQTQPDPGQTQPTKKPTQPVKQIVLVNETEQKGPDMWFCPSCGQKNKYQFCSKCGRERRS